MERKNFRTTPERINTKVIQMQERFISVSCLVSYSSEKIRDGYLNHLNIFLDETGLYFPETIIPNEEQGKHSNKNVNGEVIIRNDLPKETKYYTWEVPNWGDYSNGSHYINVPRKVYRRDFIAPHFVSINIQCPDTSPDAKQYRILFQLDEVLDKEADNFEERLFELVNILQENVYSCDVHPSNSNYQDYLSTIQLTWEIFPPGQRELFIRRVLGNNNSDPNQNRIIGQRYDFLMSLNPISLIRGTSGLQRYVGAKITDDLVVFENTRYGNAIYIMYDNWNILSQKSRTELLSGECGNNFDRVLHLDGWENKVRAIIDSKLNSELNLTA
ncbi:MAG: hypothetical protein KJ571_11955 [Bacteroidetes bacterium]|nr:hypothetical protein [Bacteroidota bacterium]